MTEPFASGPLLAGKVAFVTGGGAGCGRAICETFAAAGASVVLAERDSQRASAAVAAIERAGGAVHPVVVDVFEREGVARAVGEAQGRFGRIDVLVNNVGHYVKGGVPFHETTEEDWTTQYVTNLEHVLRCTHAVLPGMIERRQGSIISLSTVEAFRGIPGCAVYSAFKSGITQFTKSVALEVAPYGVRMNAIAPDMVDTPQLPLTANTPPEQREMVPYWMPIGRWGTPEDIAGCALFLASDLSQFVTGTTIHADGGTLAAGGWYRSKRINRWTNRPHEP